MVARESLLMICADENVRKYHLIIAGTSVNYKEQVVITDIKSDMQYSICQVLSIKRKNLCKKWPKKIYEYTLSQVALQDIEN